MKTINALGIDYEYTILMSTYDFKLLYDEWTGVAKRSWSSIISSYIFGLENKMLVLYKAERLDRKLITVRAYLLI